MYSNLSSASWLTPGSRWAAGIALGACLLLLAGCGSTKVYNSQKTLVYRGSIYNVSNVMVYSSRTEGIVAGTSEPLDLQGVDKRAFRNLLEQHNEIFVRQVVTLDQQEVVYQAKTIDSWSDFNKMAKRFSRANKDIQKFIGNPKKTQLELD